MRAPLEAAHDVVALERPWAPFGEQVQATLADLDRHGLDRPVLVGHSAGADVALAVAAGAPDRVRALVLLAPVVGRGAPAAARWLARLPGSAVVAPAVLRAAAPFLGRALRTMWHDPGGVTDDVVDGYRRPLLEPGVAEAMWAMTAAGDEGVDLRRRAGELAHPCLVIVGNSDRWATSVPVPHARTVVLERCGHLPHEEQPARTAAEILSFVETLRPAGP